MGERFDLEAVWRGVIVAGVVAVPGGIAAAVLSDRDDPPGWIGWLVVLVVLGLTFGAALAAWSQRRGTPMTHGLVVALTVFLVVQGVGVIRRLIVGDDVGWARILSSAALAALAGLVGGLLGGRAATMQPPPR